MVWAIASQAAIDSGGGDEVPRGMKRDANTILMCKMHIAYTYIFLPLPDEPPYTIYSH